MDKASGRVSRADAAGVDLYASSSTLSSLNDSDVANQVEKEGLEQRLQVAQTDDERREITSRIGEIEENTEILDQTRARVVERLDDPRFIAGFGSNGGEEFLSYMNIGEALLAKGGDEWSSWNQKISTNMLRTQAKDGSWKGKHCITGGTFCTATGMLVLMTDRLEKDIQETASIK